MRDVVRSSPPDLISTLLFRSREDDQRFRTALTILLGIGAVFLIIVPSFGTLLVTATKAMSSTRVLHRFMAAGDGIFVACALWLVPSVRKGIGKTQLLIGLLALQGTYVGLIYCSYGYNTWRVWAEYSVLVTFWCLAFTAGRRVAQRASVDAAVWFVLLLCATDVSKLLARFMEHGLDRRSAFGQSLWVASLLIVGTVAKNKLPRMAAHILFVVALLAALLSGLRSAMLLVSFTLVLTLIYAARHGILTRAARRSSGLALVLLIIAMAAPPRLQDEITKKLVIVAERMNRTMLSEHEFQFDDGENRLLEARQALAEFKRRGTDTAFIHGYGHGFTFARVVRWRRSIYHEHVIRRFAHISPIGFYVRYGLPGLFVYVYIFGAVLLAAARCFSRARSDAHLLDFAIRLHACQIMAESLISQKLTPIYIWFGLGMAFASVAEDSFRARQERERIHGAGEAARS